MEQERMREMEAFVESNREVLKKFYEDREADWKTGRVGGCDAAASLDRAEPADIAVIGVPFAEALIKAHTTGPKTMFDALKDGRISDVQLDRYLTTGLSADGKRWDLLVSDPDVREKIKDDFALQARATIDLLKGANDARLPEYRRELEATYYPEPIHASKNLNVYDGTCQYPFLRGLRDGVNHQVQYVAEKKLLVYSYMGDRPADALGAAVRPFGDVRKSYGESFVIMENVDPSKLPEVIAALEATIAAGQEKENA